MSQGLPKRRLAHAEFNKQKLIIYNKRILMGQRVKNKGKKRGHEHVQILQAMRLGGYTDKQVYIHLRYFTPLSTLRRVADRMPERFRDEYLFENPSPISWRQLRNGAKITVFGTLQGELKWNGFVIDYHAQLVNGFLTHQEKYERYLLTGNYQEAESVLEDIIQKYGHSLWALENTVFINELRGGFEKNIKKINDINDQGVNNSVTLFLDFYSKKAEKELSYSRYSNFVEKTQSLLNDHHGIGEYFGYKIDCINSPLPVNLEKLLFWESYSALIDRYLTLKKILLEVIIEEHEEDEKKTAKAIVKNLCNKISDIELESILICIGECPKKTSDDRFKNLLPYLDAYTEGRYQKIVSSYREIISQYPAVFEVYELVAKSFVHSGIRLDIDRPTSFSEAILTYLYQSLLKNDGYSESVAALVKLCCQLSSTNIARQLLLYIMNDVQDDNPAGRDLRRLCYATIHNPQKCTLAQDKKDSLRYLAWLNESYFNKSSTIQFWNELISGKVSSSSIETNRRQLYNARLLLAEDKRSGIAEYEVLYESLGESNPYYKYIVINELFDAYRDIESYGDMIDLVVDGYFGNEAFLTKIKYKTPIKKLHKTVSLHSKIEYPIAVYLNEHSAVRDLYVAVDNYLNTKSYFVPSQIINESTEDIEKQIVFLNKVCTRDVLYKFRPLKSTLDVQHERITILRHLSELDAGNISDYVSEINEITKEIMIKRGLMQIDESKIYFNIDSLKDDANKNVKENFERYKKLSLLPYRQLSWKDAGLIKSENDALQFDKIIFFDSEHQSKFSMFTEIFFELRDKFLFSNKFGLDSYLSIRIRHGTLVNELRRPFEESLLVTRKVSGSQEYSESDHWKERLSTTFEQCNSELQAIIKEYSKLFDDLILSVKNDLIQIKTESIKSKGLFDFCFDNNELASLFVHGFDKISLFDVFLDETYKILRDRTDAALKTVRTHLKEDIANKIVSLLDQYSSKVREVGNHRCLGEFQQSIGNCKTHVQTAIERVSNWFKISSSSYVHSFELSFAVDTALEIVKNAYGIKLDTIFNLNCKIGEFKGNSYTHFVDIFQIVFTNIIRHSGFVIYSSKVVIDCICENSRLKVKVTNQLNVDEDHSVHRDNVKTIVQKIRQGTGEDSFRTEDKSGLLKVYRILKYDLRQKNPIVEPVITNDSFSIVIVFDLTGVGDENLVN